MISEFNYRVRRANLPSSAGTEVKEVAAETDLGVEFFEDFNHWVDVTLTRASKDPDVLENHLRPQVDFLDEACEIFLFEEGLSAVLDWVDIKISDQRSREGLDTNPGAEVEPDISKASAQLIADFYAEDIALHDKLRFNPPRS